jgi:tRNA(fMet)-specific endonuclease VapC
VTQRVALLQPSGRVITVITLEEQIQGWFAQIRRASQMPSSEHQAKRLDQAYSGLRRSVQFLNQFQVLDLTVASQIRFAELRQQRIRIGTQDLRIAAICLVNDLTLVTRNCQDFEQVPELQLEDWSR